MHSGKAGLYRDIFMQKIPLTQGKVAIVDDEDFELLNQYKWVAHWNGRNWYARGSNGKPQLYMHRFILKARRGRWVDHINSNGLDNRRSNIRTCSPVQNNQNQRIKVGGTSKYKGVSYDKINKKWRASINVKKRFINLGRFKTEIEAATAYNRAAKRHFHQFAHINHLYAPKS